MSLFEDSNYEYRETYFVLFDQKNLPSAEVLFTAIHGLGSRYQIIESNEDEGMFESMSVVSQQDFSAMDIAYLEGEEVESQILDLQEQFKNTTMTKEEVEKLAKLKHFNARFDVFHFERVTGEPEDILDPGGLLIVLAKLSEMCDGIAVDPQSLSLM